MELNQMLNELVRRGGSDLHLKTAGIPRIRVAGRLLSMGDKPLETPQAMKIVTQILNELSRVSASPAEYF